MTMGCRYPEHHRGGHGGGGLLTAVGVVVAAALLIKAILAVLGALLITLTVLVGLALLAGAAYAIAAVRSGRLSAPVLPARSQAPLSSPGCRSLPAGERHLHLHLHGLSDEQATEIVRRARAIDTD